MFAFAEELRGHSAGLRVLNLGDVDTATPMGSMLSRSWPHSVRWNTKSSESAWSTRQPSDAIAGKDLGGHPRIITDRQIRNARHFIERGDTAAQVARDLEMSRATSTDERAPWI